jgi:imidazolonepropionase
MSSILIINIKGLVQVEEGEERKKWVAGDEMAKLPVIENAFLFIDGNRINDFGPMDALPDLYKKQAPQIIDAENKFVFPSFVDSHSHIVFAGSRESEFVDKIKGVSYEDIAKKGGGILNSAKRLQQTSEDELYEVSMPRIKEVIGFGTGALEIKSGYGLTLKDELKMLRVVKRIKDTTRLTIKATLLGAHAIPKEYVNRQEYIDLVINEMIPAVAEENLADYCDVFCEKNFFTTEETERVLEQGLKYGLKPKIHANQLSISGGVQVGVKMNAISVDHLECMGEEEIEVLKGSTVMPTALPGAAFFLNMSFPPARQIITAGLPLAVATDYNPGSSPCGNMPFMLSLACIKMRMTPEEAINATTLNTAYAMEINHNHGTIAKGKIANIFITKEIPSYSFIPYAFSSNLIETVILQGQLISED